MTDIVIVGYGNIGRGVAKSIEVNDDVRQVGIVSRDPERVRRDLGLETTVYSQEDVLGGKFVPHADVAILCGGSKEDLPVQGPAFAEIYNTVDSFDTHAHIGPWVDKETDESHIGYFAEMDAVAGSNNHTALVCAGWDPGTFSAMRAFGSAFIPGCVPKAFYGLEEKGGRSMGHGDAIKQIPGVVDAVQYTHVIPEAMEEVLRGRNPDLVPEEMHWRECKVVVEDGADKARIEEKIRHMPDYYEKHRVTVDFVSQRELDEDHSAMRHDGVVLAVGETGDGNKAVIKYENQWESNPEATGNILVACARATHRFNDAKKYGAHTMLDLSPADVSPLSRDELLKFM